MKFTDSYGEQSCTAGALHSSPNRAAVLAGRLVPSAGPAEDPYWAKPLYQRGSLASHLGDLTRSAPVISGGNLGLESRSQTTMPTCAARMRGASTVGR
jgi:hypothetical protein